MDQEPTDGQEPDDDRMFFSSSELRTIVNKSPVEPPPGMSNLQASDPFCARLLEKKNKDRKHFDRNYTLVENVIYRKLKRSIFGTSLVCVVPDSLIVQVIKEHHDGDQAVHPGQNRTSNLIRNKYWWPRLKEDVKDYVRKCVHCTMKKRAKFGKPQPQPTYFSFPPVPGIRPMQFICMDYIDLSHHRTIRKSGYIVVVSCYLTKFLVTGHMKSLQASELVVWFEENIVHKFSSPEILITDNGTNFRSRKMAQFCKDAGIKQRFIAPYRAQANGQVERMNGMIKEALSSFVSKTHKNWDRYLQLVTYALNCLASTVTGVSPFFAMYGYHPRNRFDNTLGLPDLVPEGETIDGSSKAKFWTRIYENVKKAACKLRKRKPRSYLPKFQVGDKVVIVNHRPRTGLVKGFSTCTSDHLWSLVCACLTHIK